MKRTETDPRVLLDRLHGRTLEGDGTGAVVDLCVSLQEACLECEPDEWSNEIIPLLRSHPLHQLLLQDPYTCRAYHKPRGYAGDAVMLDYVYTQIPPEGTSAVGRDVFAVTTGGPNGRSVRSRRDLLAERIVETCRTVEHPRVLVLGCGHLREAQRAHSAGARKLGAILALDQDAESLGLVRREQAAFGVQTIQAPVASLLRGKVADPDLHLVYAAGLFDYLSDKLATRLLRVMFDMLLPGGRLLVGNFTPENHGRGYMEAIMDWRLIYRDEDRMEALVGDLPAGTLEEMAIYRDENRNIVYLEARKGGGSRLWNTRH